MEKSQKTLKDAQKRAEAGRNFKISLEPAVKPLDPEQELFEKEMADLNKLQINLGDDQYMEEQEKHVKEKDEYNAVNRDSIQPSIEVGPLAFDQQS